MIALAPTPIVSFAPLPKGWHAFPTANGAYFLSWQHRPDSFLGWAGTMPRNGIAVQVWFPPEETKQLPPLKLVLPHAPATMLEGTTDTPEYRIQGRVSGRDVEVWVDIRQPHPTPSQLRVAQRVISLLRFVKPQ